MEKHVNNLVTLTWAEVLLGSTVGCMRHISALKAGKHDAHGAEAGGWNYHINGACGEIAVAKHLKCFWGGTINTWKDADLGVRLQIRTRSKDYYELIVRKNDSSEDHFVLVTGNAPEYVVRGWIVGEDAKKDMWIQEYANREAAYFVPQRFLNPMETIRV